MSPERRSRDSRDTRAPRRSGGDCSGRFVAGEIDALVVEGAGGGKVYTLHSADEPYRNLVEQMQEGAVVLTGRGDMLYANARFAALVGEPIETVIGSRFDRFVSEATGASSRAFCPPAAGDAAAASIGPGAVDFEVSRVAHGRRRGERRPPEPDRHRSQGAARGQQQAASAPSATTGRRTSSWPCWRTSCAIRSAPSTPLSGCSSRTRDR